MADGPLSESIVAAEVAWRDVLVAESQVRHPSGCCSADTWRGHLCEYHQGYADGIDEALERQRIVARWMGEMGDGP